MEHTKSQRCFFIAYNLKRYELHVSVFSSDIFHFYTHSFAILPALQPHVISSKHLISFHVKRYSNASSTLQRRMACNGVSEANALQLCDQHPFDVQMT
jgi:hypothetical protein